ncbi:hypothetical protein [Ruegeria sp. Alg231-54]|uniref:hypothetical protein n=1 Tax=Ruegeria sp. Alg231-54 TaxID=1922221 RepID=UPI00190068EC|nr:hypothetical protein [Ruegeria sp. Alg231-54]
MSEGAANTSFREVFKLNGSAGADLFFVLGGYIVTAVLLQAFADEDSIEVMHYATKRIRRIGPACVFVVALVVVG